MADFDIDGIRFAITGGDGILSKLTKAFDRESKAEVGQYLAVLATHCVAALESMFGFEGANRMLDVASQEMAAANAVSLWGDLGGYYAMIEQLELDVQEVLEDGE